MITHDMQLMLDYSDRAVVMLDGKILADKTPAEVLTDKTLIQAANLKETSIFSLAEKLEVDPLALTEFYMQERGKPCLINKNLLVTMRERPFCIAYPERVSYCFSFWYQLQR